MLVERLNYPSVLSIDNDITKFGNMKKQSGNVTSKKVQESIA
jgi:hypothetical protein